MDDAPTLNGVLGQSGVTDSNGVADQDAASPGWALWFTGLPGSGKSTIARAAYQGLLAQGRDVQMLVMDERRKVYVPKPAYTAQERVEAYARLAAEAAELAAQGHGVIIDATAHRLEWRQTARQLIPRMAEAHVRCPLAEAMRREAVRSFQAAHHGKTRGYVTPGLYAKALERKHSGIPVPGLGEVVGVDVAFEEDPAAECVLDALRPVEENAAAVLAFVRGWLGEPR